MNQLLKVVGNELRWGYERLRESLSKIDHDVLVILSPHWQTYVGTHFLGLPHFEGSRSILFSPIFSDIRTILTSMSN